MQWCHWQGIWLAIHRWWFEPLAGHHCLVAFNLRLCAPVTKQYNLVIVKGWRCTLAEKVIVDLMKSSTGFETKSPTGWQPKDRDQLRAQRLLIKYGTTLPLYQYNTIQSEFWGLIKGEIWLLINVTLMRDRIPILAADSVSTCWHLSVS